RCATSSAVALRVWLKNGTPWWLAANSAKSNTKSSQPSVWVDSGLIVNIDESNVGDRSALRSRLILKLTLGMSQRKPVVAQYSLQNSLYARTVVANSFAGKAQVVYE